VVSESSRNIRGLRWPEFAHGEVDDVAFDLRPDPELVVGGPLVETHPHPWNVAVEVDSGPDATPDSECGEPLGSILGCNHVSQYIRDVCDGPPNYTSRGCILILSQTCVV